MPFKSWHILQCVPAIWSCPDISRTFKNAWFDAKGYFFTARDRIVMFSHYFKHVCILVQITIKGPDLLQNRSQKSGYSELCPFGILCKAWNNDDKYSVVVTWLQWHLFIILRTLLNLFCRRSNRFDCSKAISWTGLDWMDWTLLEVILPGNMFF